jgi:hypothetical protein
MALTAERAPPQRCCASSNDRSRRFVTAAGAMCGKLGIQACREQQKGCTVDRPVNRSPGSPQQRPRHRPRRTMAAIRPRRRCVRAPVRSDRILSIGIASAVQRLAAHSAHLSVVQRNELFDTVIGMAAGDARTAAPVQCFTLIAT